MKPDPQNGFLFKLSDEHLHPFYMEVPPQDSNQEHDRTLLKV